MDSHLHVDYASQTASYAFLFGLKSKDEIIRKLKETPVQENGWLLGCGIIIKSKLGCSTSCMLHGGSTSVKQQDQQQEREERNDYGRCLINREILDLEFPDVPVEFN